MSSASRLSALAAQAYERDQGIDPHAVCILDWMWHPDGLGLRDIGGVAVGLYARIFAATSLAGGMYFESATKAAECLRVDRKTIVRARRALEVRGVIRRVGVKVLVDDGGVARISKDVNPAVAVNNQCAWVVDAKAAEGAIERTSRAMGALRTEGPHCPERLPMASCIGATNGGGSVKFNQNIVGASGHELGGSGTDSVSSSDSIQDVVVEQDPPKGILGQVVALRHHLTSRTNAEKEHDAINKVLRSSSYIHKRKTRVQGSGNGLERRQEFKLLLDVWPNGRKSEGDFAAFCSLADRGYSCEVMMRAARSFAAWARRGGKEPRASLSWFLRLRDGKPNSFIASEIREERRRRSVQKSGGQGIARPTCPAEDLKFTFIENERAWDVSTPSGYRARLYPLYPLNHPNADHDALVAALTDQFGRAWQTFVGAGDADVDFIWSPTAAWGGCWVVVARNGFEAPMMDAVGTDRRATRRQLLDAFNADARLNRQWLKHGRGDAREVA